MEDEIEPDSAHVITGGALGRFMDNGECDLGWRANLRCKRMHEMRVEKPEIRSAVLAPVLTRARNSKRAPRRHPT